MLNIKQKEKNLDKNIKKMYEEKEEEEEKKQEEEVIIQEIDKENYYVFDQKFFEQLQEIKKFRKFVATLFRFQVSAFNLPIKDLAMMLKYILTELSPQIFNLLQETQKV